LNLASRAIGGSKEIL